MGIQQILLASGAPKAVVLLHLDGTTGSTTFTDASGKTWTGSGGAQISTAQSMFGGASLLLSGSSQFISTPHAVELNATGNTTFECFIRPAGVASIQYIFTKRPTTPAIAYAMAISATGKLIMQAWDGAGTIVLNLTGTTTMTAATWVHVAATKEVSGGVSTWKLFLGGNLEATGAESAAIGTNSQPLRIGSDQGFVGTRDFNGYVDEFRVTPATLYTATFTPPAAPFTY